MVRSALVSFWHVHAQGYAQQAMDHPDVEVVAVWDEDPKRGVAAAMGLGLPFVEDIDELIKRDDINALIVESATTLHHPILMKAAAAGKHVFTDKVLAPTIADANEIVSAMEANEAVLFVGLSYLYHNFVLRMKEILGSGQLGTPVQARLMNGHGMAVAGTLPPGFYRKDEAAGGALIDMCHVVYVLPYLLGMPVSAYSNFASITGREVEDSAVVVYDYADGLCAIVEASFATLGVPAVMLEVHGTEGSLLFRSDAHPNLGGAPPGASLTKRLGGEKDFTTVPLGANAPSSFAQWVEHIKAGRQAEDNLQVALELSRLIEAAYQSAGSGKVVTLAELHE
jgi:1,5-anhydro-D-fructose reductase (1,5-anhydro-D-mannitol-forming)